MEDIDPEKIYVIGGIVDHNRFKGLSRSHAKEANVETVRLPIIETLGRNLDNSLNVNHGKQHLFFRFLDFTTILRWFYFFIFVVFELLSKKAEGLSWAQTFDAVLPARYKGRLQENTEKEEKT